MNSLAVAALLGTSQSIFQHPAGPNSAGPGPKTCSFNKAGTFLEKSPPRSCHDSVTPLPPLFIGKEDPETCFSRRKAIGLGLSVGLFDLTLSGWLQQSEAAELQQCELKVALSGLAYCDKVVGYGGEAVKGQLIKAHYVGKLENGKVFDSSYNRGKPLTFRVGVGEVIKGWDEGILGGDGIPPMLAGGKRTLKIPPQLGYGMRGAGCRGGSCIIPPDSVLLFDIEFMGKV